jgi:hypothetical protein
MVSILWKLLCGYYIAVLSACISCSILFVDRGSWIAATALLESVNFKNCESFAWIIDVMAPLTAVTSLEKTAKRVGSLNIHIWSGYVNGQPFPVCFRDVCEKEGGVIGFGIFDCKVGCK